MNVDVFAICYNEEKILPYFIRHYKQFARNITVYDNFSTDNSVEIMKENGINVIPYDTVGEFDEGRLMEIRNKCWKNSDADWVIVCDMDEFIYHEDILKMLDNTNSTIILPYGYNMVTETYPTTTGQIYDEVKYGLPAKLFSKPILFKPKEITDINLGPGSHVADPKGKVIRGQMKSLKLLHFKFLDREFLRKKHAEYYIRQCHEMRAMNWGSHYYSLPDEFERDYDIMMAKRKLIKLNIE